MTTGTRRTLEKSIKKRQHILNAAAKVLAQRGYAEATLAEISQEVGTHAGSMYYYFESRDELVRQVLLTSLERMSSTLLEATSENLAGVSAMDRLENAIEAVLDLYTSGKDEYARAYIRAFNQLPDDLMQEIVVKRRTVRNIWRDLLRDAQAEGGLPTDLDINIASVFLIGATNWVSMWFDPGRERSAASVSREFGKMVLHGLIGPKR